MLSDIFWCLYANLEPASDARNTHWAMQPKYKSAHYLRILR